MRLSDLALANLARRPARTGLTIGAVGIAVAGVVALTGIAWGFETSWQKANDVRGTDLIVTRVASENAMPSPFAVNRIQPTLQSLPHVQSVAGLLTEMLTVDEALPPVFVFGWAYRSYLWDHLRLMDGRWPDNDAESVVMIGSLAAELLRRKPGDFVDIEGRHFRIAGTFESSAVIENGALLMTLTQAQLTTDKPGRVNVMNIKLDASVSDAEFEDIKAQVHRRLPGYIAITSGELVRQNTVVRIAKAMGNATILIAGLVGALLVLNTMLMSVNERKREIGILLAIGWRPSTVMKLVLGESALLSLAGGVVGVFGGIAFTVALEHLDLLRGKIDAEFHLAFLLAVLGMSCALGIAGGLYPSIRAARQLPSRVLREQ
jgi:putative ABC transport system permease protein